MQVGLGWEQTLFNPMRHYHFRRQNAGGADVFGSVRFTVVRGEFAHICLSATKKSLRLMNLISLTKSSGQTGYALSKEWLTFEGDWVKVKSSDGRLSRRSATWENPSSLLMESTNTTQRDRVLIFDSRGTRWSANVKGWMWRGPKLTSVLQLYFLAV